jgi:NAD(P)-dependent dehydrogenase (short-subunit alcohol dehydrogenase family)
MSEPSNAVLITGCSSGIGRATALRLARGSWQVYATARRAETIADLREYGCKTLALDVTDEQSMRAAVAAVEADAGAVGVLVNNAGYSQSGAIETVPLDAVRRQFETNVFGPVHLTQLVLPRMRAQHWGKIVNVGSMGGRLSFPGGGHYHATKHALEAISDALRFELRGFGIDVVLLEPGLITTEFGNVASASLAELDPPGAGAQREPNTSDEDGAEPEASAARAREADPYGTFNATVGAVTKGAYEGPMRTLGGGPDRVAKAIERALRRSHPPARITVTPSAKIMLALRRVLPDRAWDAAMRAQFPQPR